MSVLEEHQDVITTVLILMEAIIVLAWMDMNWNQIITLVQVMIAYIQGLYYNIRRVQRIGIAIIE